MEETLSPYSIRVFSPARREKRTLSKPGCDTPLVLLFALFPRRNVMKTLLYVGSALIGGALMLQMPTPPPMKMGLWETTSSFSMTGPQMPPGMGGGQTVKARQCFTPETWAKSLG